MLTEEQMTVSERRKYLKLMKARYVSANRAERGCLLTEMHQVTGLHRKSVIRLMHAASLDRKKRSRPRSRQYGLEVERVVARILRKYRSHLVRLPQKGAERANQSTKGVPMGRIPWDISDPGHFEVDLVHHSGGSTAGQYGHTIQLVDVATGWSERVAILGRGQTAMEAGFRRILERLPFVVVELHPDNGSEFFNQHLVRFWKDKVTGVQLSRSRPYQKNDNRMVEQKNDTLVRQFVGQLRLDTPEQVQALGALYERMWVYYNLFQPVLHLRQKTVVGDRVKRKWDQAQTPYERVQALGVLPPEQQARLQQLYEQTNPLALRQEIYQRLAGLWDMPSAEAGTAA